MGFYHTVRIAQKTKTGIRTVTLAKNISAYNDPGKADKLIRYYGKGDNAAHLDTSFDARHYLHTLRL